MFATLSSIGVPRKIILQDNANITKATSYDSNTFITLYPLKSRIKLVKSSINNDGKRIKIILHKLSGPTPNINAILVVATPRGIRLRRG